MSNIKNRTIITGDNLTVMRGLDSGSIDLIYLDPPFNSKKEWNAPIGSKAAGAAFKDTWKHDDIEGYDMDDMRLNNPSILSVILAAREAGGTPTMNYLLMMAPRLLEMKRVLKSTGSIYLHCDPTESHGLKLLMDVIYGRDAFRNEIVWAYPPGGRAPKRGFHRKHDIILYYASDVNGTWNAPYGEMPEATRKTYRKVDGDGRAYKEYPGGRQYLDETPGRPIPDWWTDIVSLGQAVSSGERVGYPTQKPVDLLKRIISVSSNEGDLILDPFAGCATAAIAAEDLGRNWIGIDLSDKAAELVKYRLEEHLGLFYDVFHWRADPEDPEYMGPIVRSDLGDLPPYKTHKRDLFGQQEGRCNGCGTDFLYDNLTVDHIVPRKHGGTDHRTNLQLLCANCNSRKGTGTMSELMERLMKRRPQGIN